MQSKAATVDEYLRELTDDRRQAIQAVRQAILAVLDCEYEEGMQYGMIGYYVPHSVYPPGYHCDPRQPLPFACLASQKNYLSLYLGCVYGESSLSKSFHAAWAKTGKKLDMGKAFIRFKRADDLALDVIADAIKQMPAKKFVAMYEGVIQDSRKRKATRAASTKKAGTSSTAKSTRKG